MTNLCWSNNEEGFSRISLSQKRPDNFTVTYGLQVRSDLSYGQACKELGAAMMHLLSCEGLVDNRTVAEARGRLR